MSATSGALAEGGVSAGLKVIDCDTHLSEPHDLWTARVPASYRDRVPHVRAVDGRPYWYVDRDVQLGEAMPVSVVRRDGRKARGLEFFSWTLEDAHEASYDLRARLALMDRMGIHAQVVYPNVGGFGNRSFLGIRDRELRLLCATVYNDAMADLQRASGGRIFPMAMVPWWDPAAAAQEVERARELDLRGVVTCSDPERAGLPDLGDPAFEPFFRACNDLRMPVHFHIGFSESGIVTVERAPWASLGVEARLALGSASIYFDNARVLGNLLLSGVADRFPECRFVSVESGIGWIPFFLEALDHQLVESMPNEAARLRRRPSEAFRDQVYGCFWFETVAPKRLIDAVGVENVLFETDFPHPTCLYPNGQQHLDEVLRDIDPHTRRRVLQDNAAALYGIPVD